MALPSFNSLRTFESAARLLSFNLAAKELCVSPSAVSHQIRQLESILDTKLFIRMDRKVVLSRKGEIYYQKIHIGVTSLYEATTELMACEKKQVINISAVPFFATRWLMPKLSSFRQTHPDWELSINTSTEKSNFNTENLDLVIRRGAGVWPGLVSVFLKQEYLTPVCSPQIAKQIKQLSDLKEASLLHNSQVLTEWSDWFSVLNESVSFSDYSMAFQNTSQILEACIAGAGVSLIDPSLISTELASGSLVRPLDIMVESPRSHFLVYPPQLEDKESVKIFSRWILKELAR